jgi:hypothetical protein
MDLYCGRIREEYSARSHTYPKDCPKSFQKLMKTYYFLSQHPKFEVEFPPDGSRPPPKHPNSIQRQSAPVVLEDTFNENEDSNTFVKAPSRKERPSGREQSKRVMMPSTSSWTRYQRRLLIQTRILLHSKICGSRSRLHLR